MIFYLALDENNKTWIKGTQADAREINKDFTQIDVPDDKAGRMAWIQQMLDETINATPAVNVDTSDIPEATEEFFEKAELKVPELLVSPQVICEWLQDTATQREIELVFSSIGCRIGELLRENRS